MRIDFEQRLEHLEKKLALDKPQVPQPVLEPAKDPAQSSTSSQPARQNFEQRLIAANIPVDTIQRIQDRISENRLAVLNLRDKASRENWIDTQEYNEKAHQLNNTSSGIREEFGEETYDAYLYASGRPNRVTVQQVYNGSAAQTAGIQPDDIIDSYASKKIYTMNELRQATIQGVPGETVLVELIRDGAPVSTSVPRGPLGISMNITSLAPG